jgi:dTDP-4-dehydrorhamnose reductase
MAGLLVFGGNGQLAREIGTLAARTGEPVALVVRSQVDVTRPSAVADLIAERSPAVVVNAAAYTRVDDAESNVDDAFQVNETGVAVLARACAAGGTPLIHISTDYVFDGTKVGAYREDDPIAPINAYGRSKAAGEAALRQLGRRYIILRTSWLYGAHGVNFFKTILRLAAVRDELRVVDDQRGCPTGTADLAQAIMVAANRLASDETVCGTYHFAGTGVTTWHGFAAEIAAAQSVFSGRRPRVEAISSAGDPRPARRPANSELDSSRFAETFGFRAMPWRERTHELVDELCSAKGTVGQ